MREHFKNLVGILQIGKCPLCQGHLCTSAASLGESSAYFDDEINALKQKIWVKFPFTEAADMIPDDHSLIH